MDIFFCQLLVSAFVVFTFLACLKKVLVQKNIKNESLKAQMANFIKIYCNILQKSFSKNLMRKIWDQAMQK